MKKVTAVILVVCLFLLMTVMGNAVGEYDEISKEPIAGKQLGTPELFPRQNNESEPLPVNLYLYDGDGGKLKADKPLGNATTEVACPGYPLPRAAGYYVGMWTSPPINNPIIVDTSVSCSLWVKSDEGANGVHFVVEIFVNDDEKFQFQTESKSVSSTPVEIKGDRSGSDSLQLQAGDTFGVRLAYFANSKYFLGPSPDSTLIVGGTEYDTHITVITNPITISVEEPIITGEFVTFLATFNDAFGATAYQAHIMVVGKSDAETLSDPGFSLGTNGSVVAWIWDYKTDKAKDGEYIITVSLCYDEENEFRAMGTYNLKFPKPAEDKGFLGEYSWVIHPIIVIIIVVVGIVVYKKVKSRRELASDT